MTAGRRAPRSGRSHLRPLLSATRAVRWSFDRLFPPPCVECGETPSRGLAPLCDRCRLSLPTIPPPWCPRCGATLHAFGRDLTVCAECDRWPAGLVAAAPCRMEGTAARVVRALKYERWTALAEPMAASMLPAARRLSEDGAVVLVPVPLAPSRLRERGFNQAALLAERLGEASGSPVEDLLSRREHGVAQARLGREERRANVAGAFAAGAPPPGGAGAALLVDDVVTTGATAAACLAALSAAGWRRAGVVSFARALQLEAGPQ